MSKNQPLKEASSFKKLTEFQLWTVVAVCVAGYFVYSFFSDGFYQHDEAAHFLSMRRFWYDPNSILSNWAKPGFKLIYALPALLGHQAVIFFNAVLSGLTVYLTYKVAEELELNMPVLSILLLALQPFFVQLAFRNYSEIISALLLTLSVLLHLRQRFLLTALVLSYLTLIRQEFYIFITLYGIYMLFKKQWIPFIMLGIGPVIYNAWGWISTGDMLYIFNSVLSTGERYSSAYPRQGFNHYFLMSIVIFGPAVVLGLVYTIGLWMRKKVQLLWTVAIPFGLFFLMHAIFNLQIIEIGSATGGNLRYMIVVAPLAAILANQGFEYAEYLKKDSLLKILIGVFVLCVGIFMTYEHNNITFTGQRDWIPLVMILLFTGLLWFTMKSKVLSLALALLLALNLALQVEPIQRSAEDAMVSRVADWMRKTNALQRPILSNHTLLNYFLDRTKQEYPVSNQSITKNTVENAPNGTLIIWDSHYSYRPKLREGSLPYTFFTEREQSFKTVEQFLTKERRFGILVFEKIGPLPDTTGTAKEE